MTSATILGTPTTVQASASNTAGSTTTSSTFDAHTYLRKGISARVTNGATGPTIACTATVNISIDSGTTWRKFDSALAGTANNGVYDFYFPLRDEHAYAQVVFSGNTGQTVTVEAYGFALTAVA